MAGAQTSVTVDDERIKYALAQLLLHGHNLRVPFQEAGAALVLSTQQRFEHEQSPDGEAWAQLSEAYQHRIWHGSERGSSHVLVRSQHLLDTIRYAATELDLAVGTNMVYAAIQQFGGTDDMPPGPAGVPARPFLGIDPHDEDEVATILLEHLAKAVA